MAYGFNNKYNSTKWYIASDWSTVFNADTLYGKSDEVSPSWE